VPEAMRARQCDSQPRAFVPASLYASAIPGLRRALDGIDAWMKMGGVAAMSDGYIGMLWGMLRGTRWFRPPICAAQSVGNR